MTRNETPKPRRSPRREEPGSDSAAPVEASELAAPAVASRQRIAKVMARAGLCSRRQAETWIVAGRVSVNGEVLASPARDVAPDDTILIDGHPLPVADKTRLFLFHKPRGLVTSDHDPEGRETIVDFLHENWPEGPRIVTVGRLDINTEGLLLLTNDGGLARMLELPETGWLRRYRVRAKGETDQAALDALAAGIEIDGLEYAGIDAKLDRIQGSNCWLTLGLREGKNREIKRVLEHLGLEVNRLIRVSFGPFQLLELPEGAVEEVRTRVLRDQLGEKLAAAAGVDFGDEVAPLPRSEVDRNKAERDRSGRGEARSSRPASTLSMPTAGKSGRPGRQRDDDEIEPAPERRERSQEGPRRHVSALRASDSAAQQSGPRKRIERTATKDRHDRTVAVERLVTRDQPPRSPGRKRASPSAEGKRVRMARSGGGASARGGSDEPRDVRSSRFESATRAAGSPVRPQRSPLGRARTGDGERSAPPRRNEDGERFRRDRPSEGRARPAPSREGGRRSGERPDRRSVDDAARPSRRTGPRDQHDGRDRRPERPSRPAGAPPRGRPGGGASTGSGKPSLGKPRRETTAFAKPSVDGAPARRPSAGRPPFGKPASGKFSSGKFSSGKPTSGKPTSSKPRSDRPSSGKPFAGKPSSSKPGGRPGGSAKPKR